ncbi:bis(5'-nucleosyl)-tetraphosphatase (symmetrical) YqeK [Limosilactobacillus reuteri]|uniref:bis(5'-nucleosyl)-tetraphosphatase (symmetrical) n=1 Tax=Limosilactobacillus reuteri TaxID=1598 RepID=A0A256VL37_LIMRT|nr:bis(5'-nucleosyl)-tetraphosphatase (symmetrical) YqeK [Limosilactobacillus reuteri]MDE6947945.1 bis(5'-nucleosyl)-tetraphosphatase (symmetrical) YqeK [Limosilactobacillus sp.]MCC4369169.1 bis(5'-nucleosyl)-tetraphosphatase (symmetrical) YqeK [Limosilactobacillus reuteri]MCC4372324.1 bis(5'-nucleosyl)-tetraphosphatase (symmetrical) YqeK [Limosilactobacillus reuteri]MCR1878188.1 bis(5'-nucleosyl)-tetraphosphatase (symmetrical) YqeK [Limosilactobacillus reuteri]MCT3208135.1 HD domain-containin
MNEELVYNKSYIPMTRSELIDRLKKALKDKRFQHVLRVEETAVKLAEQYGVDVEKASIAGLCHDYAKQRPDEDFIAEIKKKGLNPLLLDYGNAIWHGVVGAELIKDELGIWDEDILNAVRHHTTGAPVMTKLEQVIYMADYIEPGRDFTGVKKARVITAANLQAGVAYQTKHTLAYLIENGKPVYPKTIDTYNAWVPQYEGEID